MALKVIFDQKWTIESKIGVFELRSVFLELFISEKCLFSAENSPLKLKFIISKETKFPFSMIKVSFSNKNSPFLTQKQFYVYHFRAQIAHF